MAPVSSIDNQLPLLQTNSEKSTGAENDATMPFGLWLQQKSDVKNEPPSLSARQNNDERAPELKLDKDPDNKDAQKSTKLFADHVAEKEKKPVKLFKDLPAVAQNSKDETATANKSAEADLTRATKMSKPGESDHTASTTGASKAAHVKGKPQDIGAKGIAQVVEPKTGAQAVVPKTGAQAVEPKTGAQAVEPKTGAQAVEPKTGVQAIEPKTGVQAVELKTGAQAVELKTGAQAVELKTGAQAVELKTGAQVVEPKTGAQAVEPKTGAQAVEPKTGAQAIEPKMDAQVVVPKTTVKASASGQNHKLFIPDPSVQNNTNLNHQGPQAAEALVQLKTNVKAIFNSLTPLKSTALANTPIVRHNSPSGGNGRTISIDKVKPIRLTTMPAEQSSIRKQDGKTTLQHLETRKSSRLDTQLKQGKLTSKNNLIHTEADSRTDRKKGAIAKARKEAKAVQATSGHKNYGHQSATPDGASAVSKNIDASQDGILLQAASNGSSHADLIQSEGASPDTNQNHLLGKDQASMNAAAEKSAGKTPATYASRSSAWVKTLSERTAQLNLQDPNWKTLQMKLDDGDGNMTIKVMRENEHVTVSVQFTDDALRAHAESQTSQIMDSLKEQYGEDVTFNFSNNQESELDSSLRDQAARRRRLNGTINQVEKPVPAPRYDPLSPDQHVWIG